MGRLLFAAFLASAVAVPATAEETSHVGKTVADFTLKDCYGKEHSLGEIKADYVVVAILGTECPLAKLYGPRLESLHQRFADRGVAFLGVNANSQDTLTELVAYKERHGITFPVLKDLGNRVADRIGAERTPEVFLLDAKRTVRYHGRIDDQYGVGFQRPEVKHEFLATAIEELLAGKDVAVKFTELEGCYIGRVPRAEPRGDVTYSKHVAAIFNARCVECHRAGEIAPFSLTSFMAVEGWGDTIAEVVEDGRMPPWGANPDYGHFKNDTRMTDEEKELVFAWIKNGMPEGDPADLPPAPRFTKGWRIPEPDQVIYMRDKPFDVPAEGVVDYQYFEVDPGFTEDKYIWAAEARPDNRAVVHHIIVYIKPPGAKDGEFFEYGAIDGYAPGNQPTVHSDGMAMLVPAGSKFVFEMHYTPNGSPQKDRSYVGFKFLDKDKVTKRVHGNMAANEEFKIPANASNHKVVARRKIDHDMKVLNFGPHMHLRGKAFRFEAIYPDGKREILLDVPKFDFNWQFTYDLAEPKLLPKGTVIECTAHFDNSENNPFNPNPDRVVTWGDQSWDEMMIGFFDVVVVDE